MVTIKRTNRYTENYYGALGIWYQQNNLEVDVFHSNLYVKNH